MSKRTPTVRPRHSRDVSIGLNDYTIDLNQTGSSCIGDRLVPHEETGPSLKTSEGRSSSVTVRPSGPGRWNRLGRLLSSPESEDHRPGRPSPSVKGRVETQASETWVGAVGSGRRMITPTLVGGVSVVLNAVFEIYNFRVGHLL